MQVSLTFQDIANIDIFHSEEVVDLKTALEMVNVRKRTGIIDKPLEPNYTWLYLDGVHVATKGWDGWERA